MECWTDQKEEEIKLPVICKTKQNYIYSKHLRSRDVYILVVEKCDYNAFQSIEIREDGKCYGRHYYRPIEWNEQDIMDHIVVDADIPDKVKKTVDEYLQLHNISKKKQVEKIREDFFNLPTEELKQLLESNYNKIKLNDYRIFFDKEYALPYFKLELLKVENECIMKILYERTRSLNLVNYRERTINDN